MLSWVYKSGQGCLVLIEYQEQEKRSCGWHAYFWEETVRMKIQNLNISREKVASEYQFDGIGKWIVLHRFELKNSLNTNFSNKSYREAF